MKSIYQKVKLLLSHNFEKKILENRIFSIVSLVGAITCFLSFISNNFTDNNFLIDLIIGSTGVIFIIFFYLSFFKGITKPLILPFQILIALVLTIVWFFFQGIEGSTPLFFYPALFILIFSNQNKKYWTILISFIFLAIVLIGIHYIYPEWAIPYPDKNSQVLDLSTSFIISLFILGLATIVLKNNFDRERSTLDLKNKELEMSEERFRDIAMSSGDWIWEVDTNGVYTYCSERVEEILGYAPNEMIGKTPFDSMPEAEMTKVWEEFLQIMNERKAFRNLENWNKTKSGERICIHTSGVPVFDDQGNLIGYRGTDTDVTQRKQAEEALKESEVHLRTLIQTIPELIWLKNKEGVYLSCNPMFERFFGAKEAEIAGKTDYDFVDQKLADSFREHDCAAMVLGKSSGNEEWITFADDGHRALLDTIKTPMYDSEGGLIGVLGIARDITGRKQTEEALRQSEEKYRKLFTQMSEGFAFHEIIYDQTHKAIDYRIMDVNPAFEKQVGISVEKAKGLLATQLYGVSPAPFMDVYAHVAITGEPQSFQVYFPPLNRYFDISVFSPNTGYFATIFTDITERKLAEKAVKDSQSKLSNAIKIAHLGPWEYDVENDLFTFNDNFYSIFRTNVKEVGGYTMSSVDYANRFVYPEDTHMVVLETQKAIESDDPDFFGEVEHRFLYTDGEVGYLKVCFSVVKDENGKTIKTYGINQDITEQIRIEKILRESETSLREINAAKDKFFSIIAHDLKSPFNSILGLSNMLVEQIHKNNVEGIEEYAGIIQNSSQRAMDLLLNLLEWSRSQTGKMEFSPEYFEIIVLIKEVTALTCDSARQKTISITKELPLSAFVFADKAMISTVLRNLVSNAVKFTNPGGEIIVSVKQEQDQLMVSVCDNGVGIKKDTIGKLFRIDENYSTYGTLNETGTGLGLILCKEFIEKHGGKIWVESEPGKGSKFCFTIPTASGRTIL